MFSPDGSRLAIHDRGELRMYNARTGQEGFTRQGLVGLFATGARFSPDGTHIAALRAAKVIGGGSTRRPVRRSVINKGAGHTPFLGVSGPTARIVAAGGTDGVVRVLDARTGQEGLPSRRASPFQHTVFSPDGTLLAIGNARPVRREEPRR